MLRMAYDGKTMRVVGRRMVVVLSIGMGDKVMSYILL